MIRNTVYMCLSVLLTVILFLLVLGCQDDWRHGPDPTPTQEIPYEILRLDCAFVKWLKHGKFRLECEEADDE